MKHLKHTQWGFSLIELVVVIAIVAMLAGIGIPSYRAAAANSKAEQWAIRIQNDLKVTRAKAIETGDYTYLYGWGYAPNWYVGWYSYSYVTGYLHNNYLSYQNRGITANYYYVFFKPNGTKDYPNWIDFIITVAPTGCTRGVQVTVKASGEISSKSVTC